MAAFASKLSKCQSKQLKSLAELIGLNTTATRPVLISSLESQLLLRPQISTGNSAKAKLHNSSRILSIDMGIRNLAFCVFEIDGRKGLDARLEFKTDKISISDVENAMQATRNALGSVKLITWKRTSLYDLLSDSAVQLNSAIPDHDLDESTTTTIASTASQSALPMPKEAFDPATFARLTYELVTRIFLPYNVSHVLIERQRYRSGSAPAIMEWTVRVNMLESMLHAVFGALRREATFTAEQANRPQTVKADCTGDGILQRDSTNPGMSTEAAEVDADIISPRWHVPIPKVHSINPRKVAKFWRTEAETTDNLSTKQKAVESRSVSPRKPRKAKIEKEEKISTVEEFLLAEGPLGLSYSVDAEETRNAFLAARNRKNGRSGGGRKADATLVASGTNASGKIDDLADCLLQGVAWVQWEVNQSYLREQLQRITTATDNSFEPDSQETKKGRRRKENQ